MRSDKPAECRIEITENEAAKVAFASAALGLFLLIAPAFNTSMPACVLAGIALLVTPFVWCMTYNVHKRLQGDNH